MTMLLFETRENALEKIPGRVLPETRFLLDASTAREQVEDEDDDGEYKQQMNPAAERVSTDNAKKPKNEEDDCDCPKHRF
jgi:hypothetical protein